MDIVLSILVFLGKLLLYTPYSPEFIDAQIQANQQAIHAVQNDEATMSTITLYKTKQDNLGRIVIIDREDIDDN